MSFCEKCFEEMSSRDAAWSVVCHRCRGKWDQGVTPRTLYGNPPFGVWDHLRNKHATTTSPGSTNSAERVRPHRQGGTAAERADTEP